MAQKRCLTIQDYSCLGRCSLTVALPTISSCGIETVGIPSAVLSNHTAFPSWTYHDLTGELQATVDKWAGFKNHFDAIYTGYLGNNQVGIVQGIVEKLKDQNTLVLVDPAFAESGRIYPGFDQAHVSAMRKLVSQADVIVPNFTEACFLVGERYPGESYDELFANRLLEELAALGPKKVVITGVTLKRGNIGAIYMDMTSSERFGAYGATAFPDRFHGCGDLFASALVSCLIYNISLLSSIKIAHAFVHRSMAETIKDKENGALYGAEFEKVLPSLYKDIMTSIRKSGVDE